MCVCMVQSINILSYSKKLDEEREIIGMNDSIVINVEPECVCVCVCSNPLLLLLLLRMCS